MIPNYKLSLETPTKLVKIACTTTTDLTGKYLSVKIEGKNKGSYNLSRTSIDVQVI